MTYQLYQKSDMQFGVNKFLITKNLKYLFVRFP